MLNGITQMQPKETWKVILSIMNILWSFEFCVTLQAMYFSELNKLNMSDTFKNIVKNLISPELISGRKQ